MDQRIVEYETWDDLQRLLHALGRSRRPARARRARPRRRRASSSRASDDVCTGLQLVNFLQDVPRDLALGRVYLPAEDRAPVRRAGARPRRTSRLRALLEFEAERARGLLAARRGAAGARSAGGSGAPSGSSPAAASPRSRRSSGATGTSSRSGRARRARGSRARPSRRSSDDASSRPTPRSSGSRAARARNFAYGIMVLPKPKRRAIAAIYAFAREVDDIADEPDAAARARSARGSRSCARALDARAGRRRDARRARRRARAATRSRDRRCTTLIDGGLQDLDQQPLRRLRRAARLLPARRGRGRRRLRRGLRRRRAASARRRSASRSS